MNRTKINWTEAQITAQAQRNAEREQRLRMERVIKSREQKPVIKRAKPKKKMQRKRTAHYTYRPTDAGIVYIVRIHGLYKIGKTNKFERREKELMKEFRAQHILVMRLISTHDMHSLEKQLHKQYAAKWIEREFFDLDPGDLADLLAL